MKILCIADHKDPLVYSQSIKDRFHEVELVLSAGDLPISYYDYIVSCLNKPLLFVFGNHKLRALKSQQDGFLHQMRSYFSGATYIGKKTVREKGLLLAGLGGSMWYNGDENQYTDYQMYWNVFRLIPSLLINKIRFGRFIDILVTHAPPRGIHDGKDLCHTGFKCFLWFMRTFKPGYLVHGHVHLYSLNDKRVSQYWQTTVVNAYNHIVIDLPQQN